MGMWKKLAGIGLAAAGVMTTNPYLIGAGAAIVSGDIQADGAKKAAEQQQTAADKALDLQTQVHDQTQESFSPYTSVGGGAMGTLGNLLGIKAPPAGANLGTATAGQQIAAGVRAAPQDAIGSDPGAEAARNPAAAAAPQQRAQLNTASGYGQQTGRLGQVRNGGLVQMQAPTGETEWVPREHAPMFAKHGATIIGGAA